MRLNIRVSNTEDIIDSRDIVARIEELESETGREDCANCDGTGYVFAPGEDVQGGEDGGVVCGVCNEIGTTLVGLSEVNDRDRAEAIGLLEEYEELLTLRALVEEIDNCAGDSARDGVTLIRDSHFERYAMELADEVCELPPGGLRWPYTCIDWEHAARELQHDYSTVEFNGVTYWVRS